MRWVVLTDCPPTANRRERTEAFVAFMEKRGVSVDVIEPCYWNLVSLIASSFRGRIDAVVFQNRPRRNLAMLPFIRANRKVVELRDPIVYGRKGLIADVVNSIFVVWVRVMRCPLLYRRSLGLGCFEKRVLRAKLAVAPEYGFRNRIWNRSKSDTRLSKMRGTPFAVYAGNLYSEYYARVLQKLSVGDLRCFWAGRSSQYLADFPSAQWLGELTQSEVYELIKHATAVVSINDNENSSYLPSKSVELLASDSFIVHFTKNPEDRLSRVINRWGIGQVFSGAEESIGISISLSAVQVRRRRILARRVRRWMSEERYFEQLAAVLDLQ